MRLFVSINPPDEIRKSLAEFERYFKGGPLRFTKPDHIHITLCFIGWTDDGKVLEIKKILEKITGEYKPFKLVLKNITLGPLNTRPKMVWANCQINPELLNLQKDIGQSLKPYCAKEDNYKGYNPHLTLARCEKGKERNLKEFKSFNYNLELEFPVAHIYLMKSNLKKSGSEYSIVKEFSLM